MEKEEEKKTRKKEVVKGTNVSRNKKSTVKSTTVSAKKKEEKKVVDSKESEITRPTSEKEPIIKEVIVEKKVGFNVIEVVLIMVITLLFGGLAGGVIGYTAKMKQDSPVVEGEKVPSELSEFIQVYNNLKDEYYTDLDEDKLLESGIKGLVDYLGDPFSNYMTKDQTDAFNEKVTGSYTGIGAEVTKYTDRGFVITKLLENSSAGNAGVKENDVLLSVDGQDISQMTVTDLAKLLKGVEGTTVSITVQREEEQLSFTLTRRKVELTSVTSEVIEKENKKIGLLKISVFAENTFDQFEQEFLRLQSENVDSMIVDVRDNSGGHLNIVEKIASLFVSKGNIVYQLETKGVKQPIYSTRTTSFSLPVVVLMNHSSASASEILAAALKESYGATLLGETTYGKGTVQTTKQLSSGAQIKYTIQKWLTPDGNWINGSGVVPDVPVSLDESYYENPSQDTDHQLQKAIEVLLEK